MANDRQTNATETLKNVETAAEQTGTAVETLSKKLKRALDAVDLSYDAKEITEVGIAYEKAMHQVASSTGATGKELENLQEIASNVYADNFGESMEAAAASVAEVYKRTGLVGEELQKATENAYTLQNTFGYEVNDSLQAATQLMSTFGISAEEAYTLIAQGAQKGLDQNGDMLETLTAYSTQFASLGYSAEDMFNILANGAQNGTGSIDALSEAVKEMSTRLNSGEADEALQTLGVNLDDIKEKLAAGGSDAQEAIQEIMAAFSRVEDEQDRYTLGQMLMGSQWEDVGECAVQALRNTQGEISTTSDAMDQLSDLQFDDLDSQFEQLKRQIETEVVLPIAQKYMPKIEAAIDYVSEHLDEIVEHAKPIAAAIATAFAIKKITDFGNSAVTTAKTIKTAFDTMTTSNPLDWVAIGVSALAGLETALRSMSSKHQAYLQDITDQAAELPEELQKTIDTTNAFADSWESMKQNMDSNFTMESFDYESVVSLKDALGELINADGTIKAGAEEKVSNIIDQLNQYADTGLTVSEGVIQKNGEVVASYDQISDSIDQVIEKQHAQNLLSVAEQGYQEALGNQQQLLDNETEYAKSLEENQGKLDSLQRELDDIYKKHATGTDINGNIFVDASVSGDVERLKAEIDGYQQKIDDITEARAKNNTELEKALAYISRYKGMQEDLLNGDFDKVGEGYAKLSSDFITASIGTREELKQQVSDFQSQYETLLETQKKSPELVSDEQLQSVLYLWNQAIVEAEIATGEHASEIGSTFIDTLAAAGMSKDDQFDAFSAYIQNRLNDGESLEEIAGSLGVRFTSKMAEAAGEGGESLEAAEKAVISSAMLNVQNDLYGTCNDTGYYLGLGIADGIDTAAITIATSATNGVIAAINAARAAGAICSPSHIMRDEVGYMLGLGVATGLQKSTPAMQEASKNSVSAAIHAATDTFQGVSLSAELAQTLVPQTLGILSNQGSSAVSAYNPAYQQIQTAETTQQQPVPSSSQPQGDIIIPISIGDERIETVVVNAITRANASSGGWSV